MPFQSKSQQRYMFAAESRGDLPKGTARRWAHHTPDMKALPEKKDEKKAAMEREFGVKKTLNDNSPRMERRFAVKKTLNDNLDKQAMFSAKQIEKIASTLRKLPRPIQQKLAAHVSRQLESHEALKRVFGYKSASLMNQKYLSKMAWAQIAAALLPTAIELAGKAFGGGAAPSASAPGTAKPAAKAPLPPKPVAA